jgi:hypothetical protein
VFIESEDKSRLPWHVAAGKLWSCSYAASWSAILALRQRKLLPAFQRLGQFTVLKFNEVASVKKAMEASRELTRVLAEKKGLKLIDVFGTQGDRKAFEQVMTKAQIVKLLCHGFIDKEKEVRFLLAADGGLPADDPALLDGEYGARHLISWRDLQVLPAAPEVLFSNACSSGLARIAGMGERLGVFNALMPLGTRAVVAPWWDIVPSVVLPIMDDAIQWFLTGEHSLAECLRAACMAAETHAPRWLAWSLTIEGDWR